MKSKFKVLNKMRQVAKKTGNTKEKKRLFNKCFWAYFTQCLICGNEQFSLSFNGVYTRSFWERAKSWYMYSKNPRKFLTPVFCKITNAPNEFVLEQYLKACGMYVIQEHLYPVKTIYDIVIC